jgi:hypothetical protein
MAKIKSRTPRIPKEVPGKIRFQWATDGDCNDWFAVWHTPAEKGSVNYILHHLSEIAEELVRRGYDRASIKFECAKEIGAEAPAPPLHTTRITNKGESGDES